MRRQFLPALFCILVLGYCAGRICAQPAEKTRHTGTKLEGYATVVTPDSITIFDRKNQITEIHTDKDYTSTVGIASPVTVWYTTIDGVKCLEDIVVSAAPVEVVPTGALRENIKRLIVLPRPVGVDDYQGLVSAVSQYFTANAGWYVAPPELAAEIASRSPGWASSREAIDSATGSIDLKPYLSRQRTLIQRITGETNTDAVLEIEILKVRADVRGGVAAWDGMKEPVESRTARALAPFPGLNNGWVYAVTADMQLLNSSGKLLWRNRRGFAALGEQSGLSGRYRERPLKEIYGDSAAMQRWLADALGQLVPPVHGAALTQEKDPVPKPQ